MTEQKLLLMDPFCKLLTINRENFIQFVLPPHLRPSNLRR